MAHCGPALDQWDDELQRAECKNLGENNKNFVNCSNFHVYAFFMMDPETRREGFSQIIELLEDLMYSCATQNRIFQNTTDDGKYPENRFTFMSATTSSWTCNISDCDLQSQISMDNSKYPPSSDIDIFTEIKIAIDRDAKVAPANQATVMYIISNIQPDDFVHYTNISYAVSHQTGIGHEIQRLKTPIRLLWFLRDSNATDTFNGIRKEADGWFEDASIIDSKQFPNLINEMYVCPVNGTYFLPTPTTTLPTTQTTPRKPRDPDANDDFLKWLLPLIIILLAFLIFLCLAARWKFCPMWQPHLPFYSKKQHLERHSLSLHDQIRSATLQSASSLAGITAVVSRSRSGTNTALDPWEISSERVFVTQERLGHGASSEVVKAILKGRPAIRDKGFPLQLVLSYKDGSNVVAAKYLKPSACMSAKATFITEMRLLKEIGYHSHIIPLIGIVIDGPEKLVLTQLCPFGDLNKFLKKKKNTPEELVQKERRIIAWQISDALCYLHSLNFVHRDVAARNVFLYERTMAKLGDFGLCVRAPEGRIRAGGHLPVRSLPPEAIEEMTFDEKTDIWSYGLFLWELYADGRVPYLDVPLSDILLKLKNGHKPPIPEKMPERIVELMHECLQINPHTRPTFSEIRATLFDVIDCNSTEYGYIHIQDYKRFSV
ncbi:unnamed protein product, partial [Mesorhabditis spiculigera]